MNPKSDRLLGRQRHLEPRSVGAGPRLDAAAVRHDDRAGDGETQSGVLAAALARRIDAEEAVEDPRQVLGRNRRPGILDRHPHRVVADAIDRNNRLPFASSDSITVDRGALDKEYEKLRVAQLQHRLVFEALEGGEAARVEGLMREHAYIGLRYLRHLQAAGAASLAR